MTPISASIFVTIIDFKWKLFCNILNRHFRIYNFITKMNMLVIIRVSDKAYQLDVYFSFLHSFALFYKLYAFCLFFIYNHLTLSKIYVIVCLLLSLTPHMKAQTIDPQRIKKAERIALVVESIKASRSDVKSQIRVLADLLLDDDFDFVPLLSSKISRC